MAILPLPTGSPESFPVVTVATRADWVNDPWVNDENLKCESLAKSLGGAIDKAVLSFEYGELLEEFEGANPTDTTTFSFAQKLRNTYIGKWIRIHSLEMSPVYWTGRVVEARETRTGAKYQTAANNDAEFSGGRLVLTVLGMEHLLDRLPIDSTYHRTNDTDAATRLFRPWGFNTGMGKRSTSLDERANKHKQPDPDSNEPLFAIDAKDREPWNVSQMIRYLLFFHGPRDSNDGLVPDIQFSAFFNDPFLKWSTPSLRIENRTPLAIINQLINPRRGNVWWLEYDDENNELDFKTTSTTDIDIDMPDGAGTLDAADTVHANLDVDFDHHVSVSKIAEGRLNKYDQVIVRGAYRTSTFSIGKADGSLDRAWTDAMEDDYKMANSETEEVKADRYRSQEKFEAVYQKFVIPDDWNGRTRAGLSDIMGTSRLACPKFSDALVELDIGETVLVHSMRLLRSLAIKEGYDYTDPNNPDNRDIDPDEEPEWMLPFAYCRHGGSANRKYVPLHKSTQRENEDDADTEALKASFNLTNLQGLPGFKLHPTGGLPHGLALDNFDQDDASTAPSKTKPELDWREMGCTVCAEWDRYCEGKWPQTDPVSVFYPIETLLLSVGERARFDWMNDNTVFDIDADGQVSLAMQSGAVRDDRKLCQDVARVAFNWYTKTRATVDISLKLIDGSLGWLALGTYVQNIGDPAKLDNDAADVIEVNATVTDISYDFSAGTTQARLGFINLDFAGLVT